MSVGILDYPSFKLEVIPKLPVEPVQPQELGPSLSTRILTIRQLLLKIKNYLHRQSPLQPEFKLTVAPEKETLLSAPK